MKSFIISATVGLFAALTQAVAIPETRTFEAQLTFHGATPSAAYTVSVPTDGSVVTICKSVSIESII